MAPKTRYKNLSEINVAMDFMAKSVDRVEKAILGNGSHDGLLTAMVVTQKSLSDHLDKHEKAEDRKTYVKDKLFIGTVLSIFGSIVVLLRGCTPL